MSIKERIKGILNRYTHRMGEQGTKRKIKANLQVHIVMCSVMSHSLRPHGLQPARLLCPWGFSRQEYWSGLSCHPPGKYPLGKHI